MTQNRDESVRSFGARLRGLVSVCRFTMQCTGCEQNVNYTKSILRDVLTRGLSDPDIHLDLLGDKSQDMMSSNLLRQTMLEDVQHHVFLIIRVRKPPQVHTIEGEPLV